MEGLGDHRSWPYASWVQRLFVAVTWVSMILAMGCASPQDRGDRAFELGHYAEASEHYDRAISEGSRDPDVYYRAAQAAQRQGAFANAERFFSQSLRYGGGVEVAQRLAEFYVQTSNFTQAVKVLQYLLQISDDVQPVYADIGTALMYGGHYMDAERYLTLAQQMNPEETAPYINLGVLYDNHMRNFPRAVSFYRCYLEMTEEGRHRRMIQTRLREIESERAVDTSRVGLECGKAFRSHQREDDDVDLSEVIDLDGAGAQDEGRDIEPLIIQQLRLDLPLEYDPEMGVITSEAGDEFGSPGAEHGQISEEMERAHKAYDDGRFDEVVSIWKEMEGDMSLGIDDKELLANAAFRSGVFDLAASKMERVIDSQPSPQRVATLLKIYDASGDREAAGMLCDRFERWPDYQEAVGRCDD